MEIYFLAALNGQGGLRAQILSDGFLQAPATRGVAEALGGFARCPFGRSDIGLEISSSGGLFKA